MLILAPMGSAPLGRILAAGIVRLIDQGNVEGPRRVELAPALLACQQSSGGNHQVRLIKGGCRAFFWYGQQALVA